MSQICEQNHSVDRLAEVMCYLSEQGVELCDDIRCEVCHSVWATLSG